MEIAEQKATASLDTEDIEYLLGLTKSKIIHEISSKRAVLPLILKHFGEICGLSFI